MKGGITRRGKSYVVRYPGGVWRSFRNHTDAENFWISLNYKDQNEGGVDPREYRKDRPLGFTTCSNGWLERQTSKRSFGHMARHAYYAQAYFENRNIKDIQGPELDDFFFYLKKDRLLSDKTRANIRTTLHSFWAWICKREKIPIPDFPQITYTLKWRKIVDKKTQGEILDALQRLTYHHNPKIWIFCLWLSTYINTRPVELMEIREEDIMLDLGFIVLKHSKVRDQYKRIYLLQEDVKIIEGLPRGFPRQFFFRHRPDAPRKYRNARIAYRRIQKWWERACSIVGVSGVSPYPGCRHSSVVDLGETYSPEEIRGDGTGHTTNKAFNRYFQVSPEKKREISARARGKVQRIKGVENG